jgi:serine protease inhibitor
VKNIFLSTFITMALSNSTWGAGDFQVTVIPNNNFGFQLFKAVARTEWASDLNKNILFSPISSGMALQMLMNGAPQSSTTYREFFKSMGFNNVELRTINDTNLALLQKFEQLSSSSGAPVRGSNNTGVPFTLKLANSIWSNAGSSFSFSPNFTQTLRESYFASTNSTNFLEPSGADKINEWASQATNGKVPKVIDFQTLQSLAFVLMNATYFKANWFDPFDKIMSQQDVNFTKADGTSTRIRMMQKRLNGYRETRSSQVMELGYAGGSASMYIVLPKPGNSLSQILQESDGPLNSRFWSNLAACEKKPADFYLPAFQYDYQVMLNDTLKALGVKIAFTDAADFSALGSPSTKIDLVKQNSFIKVDEEGTEAAAVTLVGGRATAEPIPVAYPVMRVDHPFLYFVIEKSTGSILFIGLVSNPKS